MQDIAFCFIFRYGSSKIGELDAWTVFHGGLCNRNTLFVVRLVFA